MMKTWFKHGLRQKLPLWIFWEKYNLGRLLSSLLPLLINTFQMQIFPLGEKSYLYFFNNFPYMYACPEIDIGATFCLLPFFLPKEINNSKVSLACIDFSWRPLFYSPHNSSLHDGMLFTDIPNGEWWHLPLSPMWWQWKIPPFQKPLCGFTQWLHTSGFTQMTSCDVTCSSKWYVDKTKISSWLVLRMRHVRLPITMSLHY